MSSITAGIIRCFSLAGDIPDCSGQYFYQNSDKSFWDKPYTIIEKDGVKIGVIGLHGVFALMTPFLPRREWVSKRAMR